MPSHFLAKLPLAPWGDNDGVSIVDEFAAGAFAIANGALVMGEFAAAAVDVNNDAFPFARSVITVASAAKIQSAIKEGIMRGWSRGFWRQIQTEALCRPV